MSLLIITLGITTALFIGTTAAFVYTTYIANKKLEIYEGWITFFGGEIAQVKKRLKIVDDQNLFEKDDDVGFVFSEVDRVIGEFADKVK